MKKMGGASVSIDKKKDDDKGEGFQRVSKKNDSRWEVFIEYMR